MDLVRRIYNSVIARPDFRKGAVARSAPARKLEPDVTPATHRIIRYDEAIQESNLQNTFVNCNADKILNQVQDDTIRHCEELCDEAIQGKEGAGYVQNDSIRHCEEQRDEAIQGMSIQSKLSHYEGGKILRKTGHFSEKSKIFEKVVNRVQLRIQAHTSSLRCGVCFVRIRPCDTFRANVLRKYAAFTLAEVLITLGVIGIVAALLLPGVIENYEKQEAISRLKKTYTTVANALQKAAVENGDLDTWDWSDTEKIVKEYLMPNVASAKMYGKNCNYGGCFCMAVPGGKTVWYPEIQYTWPGGQGITSPMHNGVASIQFMDGSCVNFSNVSAMEVWIDINGPYKKPNKVAKDLFVFYIGKQGQLLPYTYLGCDDDLDYRASATGTGCGARIIEDGWEIKYDWHF